MLSIGKLTVAQTRYYEQQVAAGRDDYYSDRGESPGRWAGAGAEALVLSGEVDADGFRALMEGRDPRDGGPLRSVRGRSKVAAFDLTFSAPKSVSVLFALGDPAMSDGLVAAHEDAVAAAVGYLEREACRVRRGRCGARREPGEGFVAAAYRHRMSRAEDPQLHTHVVAANMARGGDGRFTALHATPIYQHAKAAGFLYQAHLRAAVRDRLPWVSWGPVRNGMTEIEQVPHAVLREFSTRRRQIEERELELLAAGVDVGHAGREAIAHETRARKRYGVDTAPWREVVRARAAEHGFGAGELTALERAPALAREPVDTPQVDAQLAGSSGLTEKHNTFTARDAVAAWAAAHPDGAPAASVEQLASRFLAHEQVRRTPARDEPQYTTTDLLAHEQAVVAGAGARRGEGTGLLDARLVDAAIAAAPFPATCEQRTALCGLTSSGRGVETVEALAGTGKTYIAGLLARAYAAGGFRVLGTAPTGRAVRELNDDAGIRDAWTLTRLLMDLDAGGGFGSEPTVLIVDEAGMASTRETARVFEHARAARVKVIAIGDSGQLSSVQAGGWLGALTRRNGSHELRQVMRQRDPRERRLLARVRQGNPTDYLADKTANGHLHVFDDAIHDAERAALAAWNARQAHCPWGQAVLIARDNHRRERLNALARGELRRSGRLGEDITIHGKEFAIGDRVIARRNDRHRAVDNGLRGTIIAIDERRRELTIRSDAGAERTLDAVYVAAHLQHAYALTAHTIQGGTVEWAGVVGPPEDFTRNWSYTALSRAREATELFIIDTPRQHQLERQEVAPHGLPELEDDRPTLERLQNAMRRREDEDLALDRLESDRPRANVADFATRARSTTAEPHRHMQTSEIRRELARLRDLHGAWTAPQSDKDVQELERSEAERAAAAARERIAELLGSAGTFVRRRRVDTAALALERERLRLAENRLAAVSEHERKPPMSTGVGAAARDPDAVQQRIAELEAELGARRGKHLADALEHPGAHLLASLGETPQDSRARARWERAARRIETYRFNHNIADPGEPLGPPPSDPAARNVWRQANRELERARADLARTSRGHGREL